jgi:melanoma-associated antigen
MPLFHQVAFRVLTLAWLVAVVAAGSKTYILRSILDPLIIEHAALTDEHLLEAEAADMPSDEEEAESDDERFGPRYYGSIISWSKADQLGPLGIQYVILALILVSGRVISDGQLCVPHVNPVR